MAEAQKHPEEHKWLLDQNVPETIGPWLEGIGYGLSVSHVKHYSMSAASDDAIFDFAQANRCLIVTFDEDFADMRAYPLGSHCGIIRLRIWPATIEEIKNALLRLLSRFPAAELKGALVIIDRLHIRVRQP